MNDWTKTLMNSKFLFALVVLVCAASAATAKRPTFAYPYLLSAPWTPFTEDQQVNFSAIEPQMALQKRAGVTHAWITGGMAQWDQLSLQERLDLAAPYVDACRHHGIYSILHVGAQCIVDAQHMARHASTMQRQPDAIAVIPPFAPESPRGEDEVVAIVASIAAQAPHLPMLYYHIPGTTKHALQMHTFIPKAAAVIPNFAGVKYVSGDTEDFAKSKQLKCTAGKDVCDKDGGYYLFWAPEPKAQALPFGANAFTLAEGWIAPFTKPVYDAWPNENATWTAQEHLSDLRSIISKYSGAGRYVPEMLGVSLGPPRLPKHPLDRMDYAMLELDLQAFGFFREFPKK